jgi:PAS domain-containing protein
MKCKSTAAVARCSDPAGDRGYQIDYRVIGIGDRVERWVTTHGRTMFENGRPVGSTGVALEVTESRRAETAMRESEERFRQFAKHSSNLLWILDVATMRLVRAK